MANPDSAYTRSRACSTVIVQGWKSSSASSSELAFTEFRIVNSHSELRVEQSLQRAYKMEPASERSANTTENLNICTCERYGCYYALLIPRVVF
jgi:hypothetical protein